MKRTTRELPSGIGINEMCPLRDNISEADACARVGGSDDLQVAMSIRPKDSVENTGQEDSSTLRNASVREGRRRQAEAWPIASRRKRIDEHRSAITCWANA